MEGKENNIWSKVCYLHVPIPHDECNFDALQTCINKIKIKIKKAKLFKRKSSLLFEILVHHVLGAHLDYSLKPVDHAIHLFLGQLWEENFYPVWKRSGLPWLCLRWVVCECIDQFVGQGRAGNGHILNLSMMRIP